MLHLTLLDIKEPEAYVTYVKGNEPLKTVLYNGLIHRHLEFFPPSFPFSTFASPPAEGAIISLLVLNVPQASSLMMQPRTTPLTSRALDNSLKCITQPIVLYRIRLLPSQAANVFLIKKNKNTHWRVNNLIAIGALSYICAHRAIKTTVQYKHHNKQVERNKFWAWTPAPIKHIISFFTGAFP